MILLNTIILVFLVDNDEQLLIIILRMTNEVIRKLYFYGKILMIKNLFIL